MSVNITYDGVNPFAGMSQPVPLVDEANEYIQAGERWAIGKTINLNGFLTGCSVSDLQSARASLLAYFSENYKTLSIGGYGSFNSVQIQEIGFGESDYVGFIPYSISFLSYPEGGFAEFVGVLDPSDVIEYIENPDRTMDIRRTVSCKGVIPTGDYLGEGLSNARNFVSGRLQQNLVPPFIISGQSTDFGKYLVSSEETINRITNSVSVAQTYRADLDAEDSSVVNRYSISLEQPLGEIPTVTYQGQIDGGRYFNGTISDLILKYNAFKNSISKPYLLSESVDQDDYIKRLSYTFSHYSGEGAENIPDYSDSFGITVREESNSSLFRVSVNGQVTPLYGCLGDNTELIENQFDGIQREKNFHFDLCKEIYEDFYTQARGSYQDKPEGVDLYSRPLSFNIKKDLFGKSMGFSASFDDRYVPKEDMTAFDCILSFSPALEQKGIREHYKGGNFVCQDLGFNSREKLTVALSAAGVSGFGEEGFVDDVLMAFGKQEERHEEPGGSRNSSDREMTYGFSKTISYRNEEGFDIE